MIQRLLLGLMTTFLLFSACSTSYKYSYEDNNGPLYSGDYRTKSAHSHDLPNRKLKIVSFNIEFSHNIEEAISLFLTDPMKDVDVILLQEMDEIGTHQIARSLQMEYVYYPAIYHPKYKKNVGNAILSKWKILDSQKVKLPHPSSYPVLLEGKNYKFRKTAAFANIQCGNQIISVASTHASAFNSTKKRREFARAIVDYSLIKNASRVIVGGDFNTLGIPDVHATVKPFTDSDFIWASKNVGLTVSEKKSVLKVVPDEAFQLDHLFVKGLKVHDTGKVEQKNVSDHLPIWVEVLLGSAD